MDNDQVFCLVGNEGYRMEDVFKDKLPENVICVLPSFPRKMGTYVPKSLLSKTYELGQNKLVTPYNDSHTGIAINVLLELNIEEIFVIGYDGYHTDMSLKEQDLFSENSVLFEKLREFEGLKIVSLTDTKYNLDCTSIFSFLY
jgi:4-hydroxy 2-oxovalerate aldolase